eukprot:Sspe_Gene.39565::Locus_19084_Transcript_1_1_Confidence_1.000_Length_1594::g.39565::m.39565
MKVGDEVEMLRGGTKTKGRLTSKSGGSYWFVEWEDKTTSIVDAAALTVLSSAPDSTGEVPKTTPSHAGKGVPPPHASLVQPTSSIAKNATPPHARQSAGTSGAPPGAGSILKMYRIDAGQGPLGLELAGTRLEEQGGLGTEIVPQLSVAQVRAGSPAARANVPLLWRVYSVNGVVPSSQQEVIRQRQQCSTVLELELYPPGGAGDVLWYQAHLEGLFRSKGIEGGPAKAAALAAELAGRPTAEARARLEGEWGSEKLSWLSWLDAERAYSCPGAESTAAYTVDMSSSLLKKHTVEKGAGEPLGVFFAGPGITDDRTRRWSQLSIAQVAPGTAASRASLPLMWRVYSINGDMARSQEDVLRHRKPSTVELELYPPGVPGDIIWHQAHLEGCLRTKLGDHDALAKARELAPVWAGRPPKELRAHLAKEYGVEELEWLDHLERDQKEGATMPGTVTMSSTVVTSTSASPAHQGGPPYGVGADSESALGFKKEGSTWVRNGVYGIREQTVIFDDRMKEMR